MEYAILAYVMLAASRGGGKFYPVRVHARLQRDGFDVSLYAVRKAVKSMKDVYMVEFRHNYYVFNFECGVLSDMHNAGADYAKGL